MRPRIAIAIVLGLAALLVVLAAACDNRITQKPAVRFEVRNYDLIYSRDETNGRLYESYRGRGVLMAVGDESEIRKPYHVILRIKRIEGGLATDTALTQDYVLLVIDGVASVNTYEVHALFGPGANTEFGRPKYDMQVLGYIPFIAPSDE